MPAGGAAKQLVAVLFSVEKCHLIKTVGGRKEIIISEEPVAQGFKNPVSYGCSAQCKSRDLSLGLESGVRQSVLPQQCAFLLFWHFIVSSKRSHFLSSWRRNIALNPSFSAKWISVHISSNTDSYWVSLSSQVEGSICGCTVWSSASLKSELHRTSPVSPQWQTYQQGKKLLHKWDLDQML